MENAGSVSLKVRREGTTDCKLQVHYYTEDKEAKAGEDYEAVEVNYTSIHNEFENISM